MKLELQRSAIEPTWSLCLSRWSFSLRENRLKLDSRRVLLLNILLKSLRVTLGAQHHTLAAHPLFNIAP